MPVTVTTIQSTIWEHAAKHQKPHSSHHNMRGLFLWSWKSCPNARDLVNKGPWKFCISSGWQDGKIQSFLCCCNGGSFFANNVFFRKARVGFFVHELGPSETCQDPGLGTGFPSKRVQGKLALPDWWPGSLQAFTIKTIQNDTKSKDFCKTKICF